MIKKNVEMLHSWSKEDRRRQMVNTTKKNSKYIYTNNGVFLEC